MANPPLEPKEVRDRVDSAKDAFVEAIAAIIEQKQLDDPTLVEDYATRDRLVAEAKAVAAALAAVNLRIADKEGPEVRKARLRQKVMNMTEAQLKPFGPG